MTTPLVGWGRSTWNNATWNQGGTVDATGVTLTSSVNDVGLVLNIAVTPTGVSATASTTIQIREGWNRGLNVGDAFVSSFSWNNGAWGNGDNTVTVTGNGLTSSLIGIEKYSVPSNPKDSASSPDLKHKGNTPIPTKLERWILSNDVEITAFTPSNNVPFAAQSLLLPVPY